MGIPTLTTNLTELKSVALVTESRMCQQLTLYVEWPEVENATL